MPENSPDSSRDSAYCLPAHCLHSYVYLVVQKYMSCLKEHQDRHHFCRHMSKEYLQCRMDRDLMAKENLDQVREDPLFAVFVMVIILIIIQYFPTSVSHDHTINIFTTLLNTILAWIF